MENLLVSMLPSVNAQNWPELADDRILIGVCSDLHTASLDILDEPCPATALDACQRSVELLLECIQATIALVDSLAQRAGRRLATALAGRCQVLPKQAVVDVASTMEVDKGEEGDLSLDVVLGLCLCDLLAEVVVRGYVGVVVVFVVEFHDLA